jgi:hypothetical protein
MLQGLHVSAGNCRDIIRSHFKLDTQHWNNHGKELYLFSFKRSGLTELSCETCPSVHAHNSAPVQDAGTEVPPVFLERKMFYVAINLKP